MKSFRAGEVEVLVATDVVARGIDVDDITHVINFDLPQSPTTTSTASAAPAARAARAWRHLRHARPGARREKIADELRLHAQFEESGLSAAGGRGHSRPRPSRGPRRSGHGNRRSARSTR